MVSIAPFLSKRTVKEFEAVFNLSCCIYSFPVVSIIYLETIFSNLRPHIKNSPLPLLWTELNLLKLDVDALAPGISECDSVWKLGL